MALIDVPARLLTLETCAKSAWVIRLVQTLKRKWLQRNHPGLDRISSHLARDIGLSIADKERHQHQWPSQTTHHPRG